MGAADGRNQQAIGKGARWWGGRGAGRALQRAAPRHAAARAAARCARAPPAAATPSPLHRPAAAASRLLPAGFYFFYFGAGVCLLPYVNLIVFRAAGVTDAQIGVLGAIKVRRPLRGGGGGAVGSAVPAGTLLLQRLQAGVGGGLL
jgi:hypothetical protein